MTTAQAVSVWPWVEQMPDFTYSSSGLKTWPRISIVTPNFNYGHLIEMTIRSVLLQAYPNLEYIVIDDGSSDDSVQIIRRYGSKLAYFEHQPNQGQYPAINKGFSKATGEIYAWLNSDDIYLPWTFRTVALIFAQFPEVDWIIGRSSVIQQGVVHEIRPFRPFPRAMIAAGFFRDTSDVRFDYIQQESCFWRRELWEKAGALCTHLQYAADFELWIRFAEHADLYAISSLLGGFTMRANQNRSRANRGQYIEEVTETIHRLRKDPHSAAARLARRFALYERMRRRIGNRAAAKVASIKDLVGPTLVWDFVGSRYVPRREAVL